MNPPASPAEWNIDMESEIRPKVSEEAYRLREETILEGLKATLVIGPDDLIAPNNPYLNPKFARLEK